MWELNFGLIAVIVGTIASFVLGGMVLYGIIARSRALARTSRGTTLAMVPTTTPVAAPAATVITPPVVVAPSRRWYHPQVWFGTGWFYFILILIVLVGLALWSGLLATTAAQIAAWWNPDEIQTRADSIAAARRNLSFNISATWLIVGALILTFLAWLGWGARAGWPLTILAAVAWFFALVWILNAIPVFITDEGVDLSSLSPNLNLDFALGTMGMTILIAVLVGLVLSLWSRRIGVTAALIVIVAGLIGLSGGVSWRGTDRPVAYRATSNCPNTPQVVVLSGFETIVINPKGRCFVRWAFDGRIDIINARGRVREGIAGTDFVRGFWTESVRSHTGETVVLNYTLTAS